MAATPISGPDNPTQSSDSLKEPEKATLSTTYEQTIGLKVIFLSYLHKTCFWLIFNALHGRKVNKIPYMRIKMIEIY